MTRPEIFVPENKCFNFQLDLDDSKKSPENYSKISKKDYVHNRLEKYLFCNTDPIKTNYLLSYCIDSSDTLCPNM
jgi:hypothetical protein